VQASERAIPDAGTQPTRRLAGSTSEVSWRGVRDEEEERVQMDVTVNDERGLT